MTKKDRIDNGTGNLEQGNTGILNVEDDTSNVYTLESPKFNFPGKPYAMLIYQHDVQTVVEPDIDNNDKDDNKESQNIYITGDNLEALKFLSYAYKGKNKQIKCIYIDPPYNRIKSKDGERDFKYNDDFSFTDEYLKSKLGVDDKEVKRIRAMKGSSSHSAWLTYMWPRFRLAWDLLAEGGVIFISIDDSEYANLKLMCDDIFGAGNFIANFVWEKAHHFGRQALNLYSNVDYILCYGKQVHQNKLSELLVERVQHDMCDAPLFNASNRISTLEFPAGSVKFNIPDGEYTESLSDEYDLQNSVIVKDGKNANNFSLSFKSRWSNETCQDEIRRGTTFWIKTASFAVRAIYGEKKSSTVAPKQIIFTNPNNPMATKCRFKDEKVGTNENASSELDKLLGSEKLFSYPKPVSLVKYLVSLLYDEAKGDFDKDFTVLDFFSGSATTAQAVMELNAEDGGDRKFIMVQLPETCDNDEAIRKYRTVDKLAQDRITLAAEKIRKDVGADDIDYGFKHYTLVKPDKKLLTKIDDFDINPDSDVLNNANSADTYNIYKEIGTDTICETWKLKDGHVFTDEVEKVVLNEYTAYRCGRHLYFIESTITCDDLKELYKKYEDEKNSINRTFTCDQVVLFGYSFTFSEINNVRSCVDQIKTNTKFGVNFTLRYDLF